MTLNFPSLSKTLKKSKALIERFNSKHLSIDEAKYSKKAGKAIKLIHDTYLDMKLFVSCSGSSDIKVLKSKYPVKELLF